MKKLLSLTLALVIASVALAQDAGPRSGGPKPGGRMEQMRKMQAEMFAKLGLTAEQKRKVEALMAKNRAEMEKLRAGAKKGDRESMRPKLKALRESYNRSLKDILTPAQRTKLDTLRKEMRAKYSKNGSGKIKP